MDEKLTSYNVYVLYILDDQSGIVETGGYLEKCWCTTPVV